MNFKTVCVTLAILGISPLAAAARQSSDPDDALYRAESAARQAFSFPSVSGYVKYQSSYSYDAAQPFLVYIALKSPARLYCMNYADFQFSLRDQAGRYIRNFAQTHHFGGTPHQGYVQISGGSDYAGERCAYPARLDAIFPFRLDEMYPHLTRGRYTLQVTFKPRDGSVPATPLPGIAFNIV